MNGKQWPVSQEISENMKTTIVSLQITLENQTWKSLSNQYNWTFILCSCVLQSANSEDSLPAAGNKELLSGLPAGAVPALKFSPGSSRVC